MQKISIRDVWKNSKYATVLQLEYFFLPEKNFWWKVLPTKRF